MEVSDQLKARPVYLVYAFSRRLCEPHSRAGRFGVEKTVLPLPGFEPLDRPAPSLVSIPTVQIKMFTEFIFDKTKRKPNLNCSQLKKIQEPSQNSRRQKCDIEHVPYWGPTKLGATAQNVNAIATWPPGLVHSWCRVFVKQQSTNTLLLRYAKFLYRGYKGTPIGTYPQLHQLIFF
jgi:hypothetical protein